jgi:hypothetical protein
MDGSRVEFFKDICPQAGQGNPASGEVVEANCCGMAVAEWDAFWRNANFPQTLMKKYLVFTYYVGRPLGGIKDFLDEFDSVEEALDNILLERNRYYQIVEKDTMKVVREGLAMFKNFVPENFRSESSDE